MGKILLIFMLVLLVGFKVSNPANEGRSTGSLVFERPPQSDNSSAVLKPEAGIPDYDTTQWTDLATAAPDIILDLKYASKDNFVKTKMYECGRCFLRPPVARAVIKVQKTLRARNLGLKMFDCYRPRPVQWKLWEKLPDPRYVADPRKGSMHNRGAAVDLSLVDQNGNELDMGTPFDFFGERAYQTYTNLPDSILQRRQLLRETMAANGFRSIRTEWWHYNFSGQRFELSDMLWACKSGK